MPFTKKDKTQIVDFFKIFKPREKYGIYYQNISIVGLFSLLLIYWDLRNLLIPIETLIVVGLISTIAVTVLFIRFYKRELGLIWSFFHNITIGLIVVYLFIHSNDFLSLNTVETKDYYIERLELKYKTGNKGKSYLLPIITVKIDGIERKLKVSSYYFKDIQKTRHVLISVKQGFWKYPIIKNIELTDNE